MSDDLINRSALLEKIRICKKAVGDCANHDYMLGYASALSGVEGQICAEPAVEAEPVRRGRWIAHRDSWLCSECDAENAYAYHELTQRFTDKYCPNCGAKMDAEVE